MSATLAPISTSRERDFSSYSPLFWWHLLSLDAPTIAGLWCWLIARAFDISLPWYALVTLCLGTWCVYVADRLLDGWQKKSRFVLRERHLFYSRHRRIFLISLISTALPLGYLILIRVPTAVRADDLWLALFGLLYFAVIHNQGRQTWVPKEFAVGVLFAIATSVPTWSRAHGWQSDGREPWMLFCSAMFAAVCCWNCTAIQVWEDSRAESVCSFSAPHRSTIWVGRHLRSLAVALALVAACSTIFAPTNGIRILLASCCLSAIFFVMLDRLSLNMQSRTLRIGADLALLTPLIWMSIAR